MSATTVVRDKLDGLSRTEQYVAGGLTAIGVLLFLAMLVGRLSPSFLFFTLSLAGMYVLLSMGLNVQWGYTGLINFSVAAFWGVGAYGAALLTATGSPIVQNYLGGNPLHPLVGIGVGLVAAAVLAVAIGIPTLRLGEDYLAIATLGLAEVVRLFMLNEEQWTAGSAGVNGIPYLFPWLPFSQAITNFLVVLVAIVGTYLLLRRVHQSPWGRVLRTIRADEDLAKALGKDSYAFKMQAFVLGSVIMALGGAFYVFLFRYLGPGDLEPILTFYVWIAVILGGSGSNRGAMLGGFVVIAIIEGTRFMTGVFPADISAAPLRLLFVGLLIILVIKYRERGILPPQRELIWGAASERGADGGTAGRMRGESDE